MALDIGAAIREGADRLTTRTALLLFVGFLVVGVLSTVATQSLNVAANEALLRLAESNAGTADGFDPEQVDVLRENLQNARASSPLALDVSAGAAFALAFVLAFLAEALHVVAVRAFVSDVTDRIPREMLRRNLPMAVLNGFFGGIVVGVLVAFGLLALLVPGIFLYVSFLFLRQEIAVEDKNFIDAMADSWALAKGERFELFGLVVVLVTVGLLAFAPTLAASVVGVDALVTVAVGSVLSPVVALFGIAVTSRAYVQLREGADEHAEEEEEESVGALGPDDLPEP